MLNQAFARRKKHLKTLVTIEQTLCVARIAKTAKPKRGAKRPLN
jgi:hypothetical protein